MAPHSRGGAKRSKRSARALKTASPQCIDLLSDDNDPVEVVSQRSQPARTSRRLAKLNRKPTDTVVIYPPLAEAKGRITVTQADYLRLRLANGQHGPEQLLLNDTLVDFYVRYLVEERLTYAQLERVHIFNSFFMKRLRKSLAEGSDGTRALLKWVQDTNLLNKDFLFFPVHEKRLGGHWSLAVVCFPGLVLPNRREALIMSAHATLRVEPSSDDRRHSGIESPAAPAAPQAPPPISAATSSDAAEAEVRPVEETKATFAGASVSSPPAVAAAATEAVVVAPAQLDAPPLVRLDPAQYDWFVVDPHTQPSQSETCGVPAVPLETLASPPPLDSALQPPLPPPAEDRALPTDAPRTSGAMDGESKEEGGVDGAAQCRGGGASEANGVSVEIGGAQTAGTVYGRAGTVDGTAPMEVEQATEPIDRSRQPQGEAAVGNSLNTQSAAAPAVQAAVDEADRAPSVAAPCILFFDSSLVPGASMKRKQIFGELRDLLELFLNDRCTRGEEQVGEPPKRGEALRGLPPPRPANKGGSKGTGASGQRSGERLNRHPARKRRRAEPMELPGKSGADTHPTDKEAVVDASAPGDGSVAEHGAAIELDGCPSAAAPAGASSRRRRRRRPGAAPARRSTRPRHVKMTSPPDKEPPVESLLPPQCPPPTACHSTACETHSEDGSGTELAYDPEDVMDEVDPASAAEAESDRRRRAGIVGSPTASAATPSQACGSAQKQQNGEGGNRWPSAAAFACGAASLEDEAPQHVPKRGRTVSGSSAVTAEGLPGPEMPPWSLSGHDGGGSGVCPASSLPTERGESSAVLPSPLSASGGFTRKSEAGGRSGRGLSRSIEKSAEPQPAPRGKWGAQGHEMSNASVTAVDSSSAGLRDGPVRPGRRRRVLNSTATAVSATAATRALAEIPCDDSDSGIRSLSTKNAEQAVDVAQEADKASSERLSAAAAVLISDPPKAEMKANGRAGEGERLGVESCGERIVLDGQGASADTESASTIDGSENAALGAHLEAAPQPGEAVGEDCVADSAGDALDDVDGANAQTQHSRRRAAGPESPRWFTNASMPAIICRRAPQQDNSFDCGLYMLQFIEILATQRPPSFDSELGIEEHFGKHLFDADQITLKREEIRALIDRLSAPTV